MSNMYDAIVIGSGPAGLSFAISAARNGKKVLVLERNEKAAKKIYATGNGRCNFLNTNADHYEETLEFCKSIGIVPFEEEGRLYPRNREARSVVLALENGAIKLGAEIKTDFTAESVQKTEQGFVVKSKSGEEVIGSSIAITTGGKAGIQFGCYGDGYKFAENFGHKVIKPIPALVGMEVEEDLNILLGTRVLAKASIYDNEKLLASDSGEVQFAKDSISGICVMNLSRYVRRADDSKFTLHLDLYPEYSKEELFEVFMNQKKLVGCAMEGLVPASIHEYLHTRISKENHNPAGMAELSKDLTFNVTGTRGWKDAQVTCGGVDLSELDGNFQSSKVDRLYFAGEVLNYDGPCGGYNIGFAIYSGMKAGNAI
ncbi:MAG: aminoacetone oxidase family FAD-binding enzyme [Bacillota bacterium]|nr:aminoacetone oxidase family FAD-binding enzyme [Bacillota bacterium]